MSDLLDSRETICKHISTVSAIGVTVIGREGEVLYHTQSPDVPVCRSCEFCNAVNRSEESREHCRMSMHYGCHQSRRFDGRYIFFCHRGLSHFTSPVVINGKLQCALSAGPFLMVDHDDYLHNEVVVYHSKELHFTPIDSLLVPLHKIPVLAPEKIHALSELLYYCACYLSNTLEEPMFGFVKDQSLPDVITEYIERIQAKGDTGFYPLEKEDELLAAMANRGIVGAKALLNDLLGYIFFYSGFRFDVIRSRVLELIVLLSRAAVKGGADAELIFGLNYEYLNEINNFDNIEDISSWLSMIMNRFTDYVFHFVDVKHADVIYKAVDFIKTRYMKKISLEDVSRAVYLSPAYFSRVFKEETGYNFSNYLNRTRIEESKKLLRNDIINLADIAGMVGYEDQSYFTKVFKKMTGMTPLRYRQSRGQI